MKKIITFFSFHFLVFIFIVTPLYSQSDQPFEQPCNQDIGTFLITSENPFVEEFVSDKPNFCKNDVILFKYPVVLTSSQTYKWKIRKETGSVIFETNSFSTYADLEIILDGLSFSQNNNNAGVVNANNSIIKGKYIIEFELIDASNPSNNFVKDGFFIFFNELDFTLQANYENCNLFRLISNDFIFNDMFVCDDPSWIGQLEHVNLVVTNSSNTVILDERIMCAGGNCGTDYNVLSPQQPFGYNILLEEPGVYSLTVTDEIYCSPATTKSATITVYIGPPLLSQNIQTDINLCSNQQNFLLDAPLDPNSPITQVNYLWSNGQASSSIQINPPVVGTTETYSVTITAPNGCTDTRTFVVNGVNCCLGTPDASFPNETFTFTNPYFIAQPLAGINPALLQNHSNSIAFNGSFVIAENSVPAVVSISNCSDIKMGPNARIIINEGQELIIQNSTIKSCSELWSGIEVNGGKLTINDCFISDAKEVVMAYSPAKLIITNNGFTNNFNGIHLVKATADLEEEITNNVFKTTSSTGLKPPLQDISHCFSGIIIEGSEDINIGDENDRPNIFSGINNGIYAKNSTVNVWQNRFENIQVFETDPANQKPEHGVAVFAETQGSVFSIPNYVLTVNTSDMSAFDYGFEDCKVGIKAASIGLNVHKNSMNNVAYGIWSLKSINKKISISNNTMKNMRMGITLASNLICNHYISLNEIRCLPFDLEVNALRYGISVNDMSPGFFNYNFISANTTYDGRYGIRLLNNGGHTDVLNNYHYFVTNESVFGNQAGIFSEGGEGSNIQQNYVEGNGANHLPLFALQDGQVIVNNSLSNWRKSGLLFNNSVRNVIHCNWMENIGYGLRFQANCQNSIENIHENKMGNTKYGMVLNYSGNFGYVGFKVGDNTLLNNNQFIGPFNNLNTYRTYNWTLPGGELFVPRIYRLNLQEEPLYNGNNTPFQNLSIDNPTSDPNPETQQNCIDFWGAMVSSGSGATNSNTMDEQIATESISLPVFQEGAMYMSEKDLYKRLDNDQNLINSSSILSAFYQTKQSEDISKFKEFEDYGNELSDTSLWTDSMLVKQKVETARLLNQSTTSNRIFETNERMINAIIIKYLKGEEVISETEISNIKTLAQACPYVEGPSVYTARSIASVFELELAFDDQEICNSLGYFKTETEIDWEKVESQTFSKNEYAYFVQNPAKGTAILKYETNSEEDVKIVITDLLGKVVISKLLNKNSQNATIDVHDLSTSVYLYKVFDKQHTIGNGKLIIN